MKHITVGYGGTIAVDLDSRPLRLKFVGNVFCRPIWLDYQGGGIWTSPFGLSKTVEYLRMDAKRNNKATKRWLSRREKKIHGFRVMWQGGGKSMRIASGDYRRTYLHIQNVSMSATYDLCRRLRFQGVA